MSSVSSRHDRVSLNRIYHKVNLGWFVEVREGKLGPYLNYLEANRALRLYVQEIQLQRQRKLLQPPSASLPQATGM